MVHTYSIYRQRAGTKVLILWDGPGAYSLKYARTLLNRRESQQPEHKLFIVPDNPS
jgi:hypothetical protein